MAMPMADNRLVCMILRTRLRPPAVAWPRQRHLQLLFNHRLDKARHLGAQDLLDRIESIVEKSFVGHIARRLHGITFHGVISIGVLMPILFVETTRRLRHLQIPTTPATATASAREYRAAR